MASGNPFKNQYKYKFEKILISPKFSKVLLIFGEIDCRLDGGIKTFREISRKILMN